MAVRDEMERKLRQALAPERLVIIDESERHVGHAGWRPGGETHFRVEIVSAVFEGKSRVDRQRMVNDTLALELQDHIHALSIRALTPAEDSGKGLR